MSGRITDRRVAEVRDRLSETQSELVEHVEAARLLSGRQLRRLNGADTPSAQRLLRAELARLVDWRVLGRLDRRVGGVRAGSDSYVYALDVLGQRLIDPTPQRQWRRPWTPSVRILDHTLSAAEVYVDLREAEAKGHLELLTFSGEPACWRVHSGAGGGTSTLKPDAHLVVLVGEIEQHRFLEVDRSTESLPWIVEKAKVYGRYWRTGREQAATGVFPQVLWSTPDSRRRDQIIEAIGRLPADDWQLHQVATAEDTVPTILGEVASQGRAS